METITSVQNNKIKELLNSQNSGSGFLLIEGEKLIAEALTSGHKITAYYVLKDKLDYFTGKFGGLCAAGGGVGPLQKGLNDGNTVLITENVLNKLADTKTPQGIVAVVEMKKPALKPPDTNFLVLDGVSDPGNLGTILRSAVGANFLNIYLINCVSFKNSKAVRAGMGAVFKLNIFEVSVGELKNIIRAKGANGMTDTAPGGAEPFARLYYLDMQGENIFDFGGHRGGAHEIIGLVVGSEAHGVSGEVKKLCTGSLKIPMQNNLESLNAAVAAGIAMYVIENR